MKKYIMSPAALSRVRKTMFILFVCFVAAGCRNSRTSETIDYAAQYASEKFWYQAKEAVDTAKVDLFYLISTETSSSMQGRKELFNAQLTDEELRPMYDEMSFMEDHLADSLNFFAPYYHQFTMNAIKQPTEVYQAAYEVARDEVFAAFDYYMEHLNGGRRFALAGFSQGAMLTLDLLKHMTDEQYSRLVGAYMLGYRISREDLANPHVRPAKDADETGVAISYNSVTADTAVWPLVSEGAATCINPLNWRTDTTPARFLYNNDTVTVAVDTNLWVLKVKGVNPGEFYMKGYAPMGNLHRADLFFYLGRLQENLKHRAYQVNGK